MRKLRLLVACEYSGVVRDAFSARGWDAWSCDLLPTESPGQHIQGDVLPHLNSGWDAIIGHPPCTYLANSGARWLFEKEGRWQQLDDAAAFFLAILNAPCAYVAVENPRPHKWGIERVGRPKCVVQPWEHGDRQKKATCFWLRGLPPLLPTATVGPPPETGTEEAKAWESVWRMPPGPDQSKNRAKTFPGIARAMADQWGPFVERRVQEAA